MKSYLSVDGRNLDGRTYAEERALAVARFGARKVAAAEFESARLDRRFAEPDWTLDAATGRWV